MTMSGVVLQIIFVGLAGASIAAAQNITLDTAPPTGPGPAGVPMVSQDCKNAATGDCDTASGAPANLNACVNNAIEGNFAGASSCCDAYEFILSCVAAIDVCEDEFFTIAQGWAAKGRCTTPSPSPTATPSETPVPETPLSGTPMPTLPTTLSKTPIPTSSIITNSSSSTCFPKGSLVSFPSGEHAPIETLNIGDRILVGTGVYSEVFFFSHRDPNQISDFMSIHAQGESGTKTLTLSPSHLIFVNGTLKAARLALVGDFVASSSGAPLKIICVETVRQEGLYNPHTSTGILVVNGIRTSCFTEAVEPKLAHALLRPLELAYRLGLRLPRFLDKSAPTAMLSLVSSKF
uniref:Hint domain-containing protein n=1 Tax=Compsopogon caeruleus TaxID=31354 RepID=A0A7S1TAY2_9RHOD|mmetsp:Transcript_15207/g.30900  ORF Transcript_15207/g.30900 Transcript_15207/m.30900 type:complete len:348 (+) Transcript_15207:97-1140(+)